ncbi:MAG TPA: YHS domain-containing protein [Patescibacteria group bacterium]|nr:YHS domain-containing protein [Patescibacteria group bacterium]
MRKSIVMLTLALLALSFTLAAAGEKETVLCPVCGYMFEKSMASSAEHEGTVYYFCEPGCKAYFLANPGVVTSGKTYDAVCGMEIDKAKAIRAEHEGREIHFCSDACKEKYFADPAAYEINYDVVGQEVRPVREMTHKTEYEGRTYQFVSEENKKKFAANPDAYLYAECPISGKVQLRKDWPFKMEHNGTTYYFRSEACMNQFREDPESVLKYRKEGTYAGCKHEGSEGCMSGAKECPHAKKMGGCPRVKEQKECPHSKEQKETGKKGTTPGCCGDPGSDRCY